MSILYQSKIIISFIFIFSYGNVFACSMGLTLSFMHLPVTQQTNISMQHFLDENYGERQWYFTTNVMELTLPEIIYNGSQVTITIGTKNITLAGVYEKVILYGEEHIRLLEAEKFTERYLPSVYYFSPSAENSPNAFKLGDISHQETKMTKYAEFLLSESSLPYIETRVDFSTLFAVRLFAVFIPRATDSPIEVIRQTAITKIPHNCNVHYFIQGSLPDILRETYQYE